MKLQDCKPNDRVYVYLDTNTTNVSSVKTKMRVSCTVMGVRPGMGTVKGAKTEACIGWSASDGICAAGALSVVGMAPSWPGITKYMWVDGASECEPYTGAGTQARNTTAKPAEAPCTTCGRMNFLDATQYINNKKSCWCCGSLPH